MIRALIVSATIAALYALWVDRPAPARVTQVDYCNVDMRVGRKDQLGVWHYGWTKMYRPCTELDRYEQI